MSYQADDLLLAIAKVLEYKLRGSQDSGLQELRRQLKRAMQNLEYKQEEGTSS